MAHLLVFTDDLLVTTSAITDFDGDGRIDSGSDRGLSSRGHRRPLITLGASVTVLMPASSRSL
jgi:hypothetical protein